MHSLRCLLERPRANWQRVALTSLLLGIFPLVAVACGDTFSSNGGGAGSSGTGGDSSATGGSTGSDLSCEVDDDCVAAVNMADPCFSPGCTAPMAARLVDVQTDPCLFLWEDRNETIPEQCTSDEAVACPASCALEPTCTTATCSAGACQLDLGYSTADCTGGGTGGTTSDSCLSLADDLLDAIGAAKICAPAQANECDGSATVTDPCGCAQLLNQRLTTKVAQALEASTAFHDSCEKPTACSDCPDGSGDGTCVVDTSSGTSVTTGACEFTSAITP